MSTSGDVQYIGDIMMHVGRYYDAFEGYRECIRGCSVHWGIVLFSTSGGYHDACGGAS